MTINKKSIMEKIKEDYPQYTYKITNRLYDYCKPDENKIWISKKAIENPIDFDIYNLLHEIGHIQTFYESKSTAQSEYYASMWGLEHLKDYGIELSDGYNSIIQSHIDEYLTEGDNIDQLTIKFNYST